MRFFILMLTLVWAAHAQQFIPSGQLSRQDNQPSAGLQCVEDTPKLRFEIRINGRGEVESAKAIKPSALPVRYLKSGYRLLKDQAQKLVMAWRFRPMLVAGKPTAVRSVVTVPCQH